MSIRLYEFEASNACLVTRLGLELKQIEYHPVRLTPFLHVRALKRLGFERRTVPALEIDGRRVQGSLEIARELDVLRPEPPLFPAEPSARRAVEAAEALGEEIQKATRRLLYSVALRSPFRWARVMRRGQPLVARVLLTAAAPVLVRIAGRYVGATDARARIDLERLTRQLAQVEALLDEGTIGGPLPNAADLQIGVNVAYLLLSDDLAPLVGPRAAQHARRIAPHDAGPFPSVLPAKLFAGLAEDEPRTSRQRR